MDFLINQWMWVFLALASGALILKEHLAGQGGVSTQEAVHLINREKGVVIDVSTAEEFAAAHVNGARHVPQDQLATSKDVPSNKTLPLVVICATGKRAEKAAATLTAQGHNRVVVLRGGLAAWRADNLPIATSA